MDSSQMSQTQANSARYGGEEITEKANEMVRFFLATSSRKGTIKRSEINDKVLKNTPRIFNIVFERASEIMSNVFGMQICEVERPNKSFCLVNCIDLQPQSPHITWETEEYQHTGLLMLVLSIVYMNGQTCTDEHMYEALERLGVSLQGGPHEVFGDVKKLLTQDYVQRGYLHHRKIADTDPPKFEYLWGARASVLTTKADILSFVCQIYDDMNLFDWPQQYDDINGEGTAAEATQQHVQSQANGTQAAVTQH